LALKRRLKNFMDFVKAGFRGASYAVVIFHPYILWSILLHFNIIGNILLNYTFLGIFITDAIVSAIAGIYMEAKREGVC